MTTDVKRLREPAAIVLLAFAAIVVVVNVLNLFILEGDFAPKAAQFQDNILNVAVPAAVVVATLLVARVGETTSNARTLVLTGLIVLGIGTLFGLIMWLAALGNDYGPINGGWLKTENFLVGLGGLAVFAIAGLYLLAEMSGLQASRQWSSTNMPGYGYPGQEQQPGWQQPPPQQGGWQQPPQQGQPPQQPPPPGSGQPGWQQPPPQGGYPPQGPPGAPGQPPPGQNPQNPWGQR